MSTIRIEAEKMNLTRYRTESGTFASGGQFISLVGSSATEIGTASFSFSGATGLYQIAIAYFDEDDGQSQLKIYKQGGLLKTYSLAQERDNPLANAQTRTYQVISTPISLKSGDTFQIQGIFNQGERARVDYVEFIPVLPSQVVGTNADDLLRGNFQNNILAGKGGDDTFFGSQGNDTFKGNSGSDTADYSQLTHGIIANLRKSSVLKPLFGASVPKIMALGDSITAGQHSFSPTPGSYRIQLWNNFVASGLKVDFVGSQSNGPSSLGDRDHEGYPGFTIDEITNQLNNGILSNSKPDIITLMIGTNDALGKGNNSVSGMYADLSRLIDKITSQLPSAQLLVSSLPPIAPSRGQVAADKAKDFNQLIPDLARDKAAQGKKVSFVNAGGSLSLNDLLSDGLHPTAAGYNKLGQEWYRAIVKQDTLLGVENIVGTDYDDILLSRSGVNVLTGGGSKDTFVYGNPRLGNDNITDFRSGQDLFSISASGFGGGLKAEVSLKTTAAATGVLVSGTAPISIGHSANFLYDTDNGLLSFDVDGLGAKSASIIANLTGLPSLNPNNFRIVISFLLILLLNTN